MARTFRLFKWIVIIIIQCHIFYNFKYLDYVITLFWNSYFRDGEKFWLQLQNISSFQFIIKTLLNFEWTILYHNRNQPFCTTKVLIYFWHFDLLQGYRELLEALLSRIGTEWTLTNFVCEINAHNVKANVLYREVFHINLYERKRCMRNF